MINHTKEKFAISKNNKIEAVIIDVEEYEKLQRVYDLYEEKEIELILSSRAKDDKKISHTKVISLDI